MSSIALVRYVLAASAGPNIELTLMFYETAWKINALARRFHLECTGR